MSDDHEVEFRVGYSRIVGRSGKAYEFWVQTGVDDEFKGAEFDEERVGANSSFSVEICYPHGCF